VPLLVEHFRSHISQTACDGCELLFRGFEVLGAARSNDLDISPESTSRDDVRRWILGVKPQENGGETYSVSDVVIVQVLHARQDKTNSLSISYG
jgi:hypothetical protein